MCYKLHCSKIIYIWLQTSVFCRLHTRLAREFHFIIPFQCNLFCSPDFPKLQPVSLISRVFPNACLKFLIRLLFIFFNYVCFYAPRSSIFWSFLFLLTYPILGVGARHACMIFPTPWNDITVTVSVPFYSVVSIFVLKNN